MQTKSGISLAVMYPYRPLMCDKYIIMMKDVHKRRKWVKDTEELSVSSLKFLYKSETILKIKTFYEKKKISYHCPLR